jgi:poly(3-hydroxybutyrate) depolymerase
MRTDTAFDWKGPASGYAVAAPNGLPGALRVGGTWALRNDAGDGYGDVHPDVDDAVFVADMVKCISALGVPLRKEETVLAGFSIGAKFASRLACAPRGSIGGVTIRALALAGGIQAEASRACPGGPVPLLLFQGAGDPQVPFCSRAAHMGPGAYTASAPQFDVFTRYNGGDENDADVSCSALGDAVVYAHPPHTPHGAPTTLFWLPAGTHVWPRPPAPLGGCAADASDVALAFYSAALGAASPADVPPVPRALCGGLAPCRRDPPCGRLTTSNAVSFRHRRLLL